MGASLLLRLLRLLWPRRHVEGARLLHRWSIVDHHRRPGSLRLLRRVAHRHTLLLLGHHHTLWVPTRALRYVVSP